MRLEFGLQSTGRVKAERYTKWKIPWACSEPSYSIAWEIANVNANVDLSGANTNHLLAKSL